MTKELRKLMRQGGAVGWQHCLQYVINHSLSEDGGLPDGWNVLRAVFLFIEWSLKERVVIIMIQKYELNEVQNRKSSGLEMIYHRWRSNNAFHIVYFVLHHIWSLFVDNNLFKRITNNEEKIKNKTKKVMIAHLQCVETV